MTTQTVDLVFRELKSDEGFRANKYIDTTGHETIGYGFNIDAGISPYAAAALLQAQIEERLIILAKYDWYKALDPVRASVFLEVSFNVGMTGMLHFTSCIHYASIRDWPNAQKELLDSDAARKLPARYATLGQMLLTGIAA